MEPLSTAALPKNNTTPLPQGTQRVVNQPTLAAHVSHGTSDFDQNPYFPVFERFCEQSKDCVEALARNLDLKTLLLLRLLFKKFSFLGCELYKKRFVSIGFDALKNAIIGNDENKFVDKKVTLKIETINELRQLNGLLVNQEYKWTIEGLHLANFGIDRQNAKYIEELFESIVTKGSIFAFGSAIKGLSIAGLFFRSIDIPDKFCNLESLNIQGVNCISLINFPKSLCKLKCLTIGNISRKAVVEFPDSLNALTTFTMGNLFTTVKLPELPNLKKLSIAGLLVPKNSDDEDYNSIPSGYGCLKLSTPSKLEYLSIEKIDNNVTCDLSGFTNLKTLDIGNIGWGVKITLPHSLDSLTHLILKNIKCDTILELPKSLNGLISFSIGEIENRATIKFLSIPKNFETLKIGSIEGSINFCLPGWFPNFKTLAIDKINNRATFELPDKLSNIEELSIKSIEGNAAFKITCEMANLKRMTIQRILSEATCDLQASLPKLTSLILGCSEWHWNATIKLPNEFKSLISLDIGRIKSDTFNQTAFSSNFKYLTIRKIDGIGEYSKCKLPDSIESLESLTIGSINIKVNLVLPKALPSLKILRIEKNGGFTVKLPNSLNNLVDLFIGNHRRDQQFKLPKSLNNLQSCSFACVEDESFCEFISSLTNLRSLSIEELDCDLKLPESIKLTTLRIGYQAEDVTFEVPSSLQSLDIEQLDCDLKLPENIKLTTLRIGSQAREVTFQVSSSLQSLERLTVGSSVSFKAFPDKVLQNLKYLEIKNISNNAFDFLNKVPNLTDLVIQKIDKRRKTDTEISFKLPEILVNLKTCTISEIGSKFEVNIEFPDTLKSLNKLTIGTIGGQAILRLNTSSQNSCDSLENLIVGDVNEKARLQISNKFDKLKKLELGNIKAKEIDLPAILNQLEMFSVGNIECKRFQFPESLESLITFKIGFIDEDVDFKLPERLKFPKLTKIMELDLPDLPYGRLPTLVDSVRFNVETPVFNKAFVKLVHEINKRLT